MKSRLTRVFAVLLFAAVFSAVSQAAMVRGRLVHGANGYPTAGIAVTVYNPRLGRSSPSYTDGYGMYYIYNVPPGSYYLELWVYPSGNPIVYPIQVGDPYTDIPQIAVPF